MFCVVVTGLLYSFVLRVVSISICMLVNIYSSRCGRRMFFTFFLILLDVKSWVVLYSMPWRHGEKHVY